jgi:hypothetical protein
VQQILDKYLALLVRVASDIGDLTRNPRARLPAPLAAEQDALLKRIADE